MLCDICKKNHATIHVQEIMDDMRTALHFCADCAAKHGIVNEDGSGIELTDMMYKLSQNILNQFKKKKMAMGDFSTKKIAPCPHCGMTIEMLQDGELLGCPICYQIFSDVLDPIINDIQPAGIHLGKVADSINLPPLPPRTAIKSLTFLQKKLDLAVASEEYERAAELRDEIKKISKE